MPSRGWLPSPTRSSSTTGRSTRARTTPCCGSRAGGRCRCGARAARSRACSRSAGGGPARARLRRRAQEHVLRRPRPARVGLHHIGDLKNVETLASFAEGIAHFERLFAVAPEVVAHDLHPDYLSTTYALARDGVEHVAVQHHHAHLAAALAEHGETAAGGRRDLRRRRARDRRHGMGRRAARRRPARLRARRPPVARAAARRRRAVREPWRMACSWLMAAEYRVARPVGGGRPGALARRRASWWRPASARR